MGLYRAAHACEIVLIYRRAITRSHILGSRVRAGGWQNRGRAKVDKDRERKEGESQRKKEETNEIKGTEIEQHTWKKKTE